MAVSSPRRATVTARWCAVLVWACAAVGCGEVILPADPDASPGSPPDAGQVSDAVAAIDAAPGIDAIPGCADVDLGSELGSGVYIGNTEGAGNDSQICDGEDNDDVSLAWTAPSTGSFVFHTCGSDFDTVLSARADSCAGEVLACSDDFEACDLQSRFSLELVEGERIILIVDGFDEDGGFVLSIEPR